MNNAVLSKAPYGINCKKQSNHSPSLGESATFHSVEERIIQLETLSAMQDETIASLNAEIFRQQQDVAKLNKRLDRLEDKLGKIQGPEEISGNERPPHY